MKSNAQTGKTVIGIFLAAASIFIWGITFVSTKYLLKSFSALEILIIRYIIAFTALWILCPKPFRTKSIRQELLFVFAGLTGVTLYQFLENIAISYTTASNVSIIVSICPIFTAVFSQIFLKEKHLNAKFLAGCVLAVAGVVLVSFNGSLNFSLNPKGDLLALAAGLSWGFYSIFTSLINSGTEVSILQKTRRTFFWAVIFMIPLILAGRFSNGGFVKEISGSTGQTAFCFAGAFNGQRFSSWPNWLNLAFLGLGASAFCFAAWNKACIYLGTVRANLGIYMIPIVTIVFAVIVLHEQITPMGLCGTALTIAGLVVCSR